MTRDELIRRTLEQLFGSRFAEFSRQEQIDRSRALGNAFDAAEAAEREACARLAEDWARGAAVVNDAEGRPLDPRQDIETAGDQIADAIRSRTP
jgi:hypothetical protein